MTDPTVNIYNEGVLVPAADPEPDAGARVVRTILQVLVAVCGAIPAAVALLPVQAHHVAWIVGIAGALVLLVTAVQNAWEASPQRATFLARRGGDAGQGRTDLVSLGVFLLLLALAAYVVIHVID